MDSIFDSPDISDEVKQEIKSRKKINREVKITIDGVSRIYQTIITPLENSERYPGGFIIIGINLTPVLEERQEKEHIERLFSFASDSSAIGIRYDNLQTGRGMATQSWYKNLNEPYLPEENPHYLNVYKNDRELLLSFRERVLQDSNLPPFRKDIRVKGKDRNKHWIREHIFINQKDPNIIIELNFDVSGQKRKENRLRKAKQEAESAHRDTEAFLANINHEVRTPLNSIVGFSAILAQSETDEDTQEHIGIIHRNNQLLTMLINDIIELSRIESGAVEFEHTPIDMEQLFEGLIISGYANLYQKQLVINSEIKGEEGVVYSDRVYLERLFKNLLSNAIKFTNEGSVTLGYQKEDDYYYFYVKDTGCGVSEENQKHIFKSFRKVDIYKQGTGLGLTLCRSIIDHMGGRDRRHFGGRKRKYFLVCPAGEEGKKVKGEKGARIWLKLR